MSVRFGSNPLNVPAMVRRISCYPARLYRSLDRVLMDFLR